MQIVENNLRPIYRFFKFGNGHQKHELFANILQVPLSQIVWINTGSWVAYFPLNWESFQPLHFNRMHSRESFKMQWFMLLHSAVWVALWFWFTTDTTSLWHDFQYWWLELLAP
jgi:hypothetical protein